MADESTKTRIIEAAGPLFARSGFEHATVRDICREADVNVASIKYYFGDKKNLYLETVKYARQSRADRYPFPQWQNETSPEEKLYDFVSALLRRLVVMSDAPWQVNLLMRELMKPDEACRMIVREHFQPMFRALLFVIDQLVDEPLQEDDRLKVGFSIIGQCLHYRYGTEVMDMMVPENQKPLFQIEQIADHITRFCLSGLAGYTKSSKAKASDAESAKSESVALRPANTHAERLDSSDADKEIEDSDAAGSDH